MLVDDQERVGSVDACGGVTPVIPAPATIMPCTVAVKGARGW